jgi:hypothetical protein
MKTNNTTYLIGCCEDRPDNMKPSVNNIKCSVKIIVEPSMMGHISKPSVQEAEAGGSEVGGQPQLVRLSQKNTQKENINKTFFKTPNCCYLLMSCIVKHPSRSYC